MKKFISTIAATLLTLSMFLPQYAISQSPEKMSYQSVVRNATGDLVTESPVGIQISILQGSAGGVAEYVETHSASTNVNGLVSLEIGMGNIISGTFAGIDWSNGPYFIKTEIDPSGGVIYSMSATSELLSVPYALHAANVSGLEAIDEGNGIGWRILGRDSANYDDIGENAVDLSTGSFIGSTTGGASGAYSTAMGRRTNASGDNSTATGIGTTASASGSTAMGYFTLASGDFSTAMGNSTNASGNNSTAMGKSTTASEIHSTAMGEGTTASGVRSTAMGSVTEASGTSSTAMGSGTEASGDYSTAMGRSTTASGPSSTAMGHITLASGDYSTAMGNTTAAIGDYSTAMGGNTAASGDYSIAMGESTIASGFSSTAMGNLTTASDYYSTAMGQGTTASGRASTAMGFVTTAPSYAETAIGSYNTEYTPISLTSWNASDRLFVVGNGTSSGNSSDALTILKNGRTSINSSDLGLSINAANNGLQIDDAGENGVHVTSAANNGVNVTSADNIGVVVISADNIGGFFKGVTSGVHAVSSVDANPDLILGGTSGTSAGDNGVISSDPAYAGSDILLRSNDAVAITIDFDDNEDGEFEIFNGAGTEVFEVKESGDVRVNGSLIHASDKRLKKDLEDLPYGLKEILQLQPKAYNWKDRTQEHKSFGLIAQDVQALIKEIVTAKDDAEKTLGISYTALIPVLIKAIQEQQETIYKQEEMIEELKDESNTQAEALNSNTTLMKELQSILNQQSQK